MVALVCAIIIAEQIVLVVIVLFFLNIMNSPVLSASIKISSISASLESTICGPSPCTGSCILLPVSTLSILISLILVPLIILLLLLILVVRISSIS